MSRAARRSLRAFAVAALACAALMGFSATAQAQTDVLSATLTVKDLGNALFGCTNDVTGVECSTTSVLTDDDFTYDNTDYAVHAIIRLQDGSLQILFDTDLTTATQTLTLDVAGTTFAFEDATTKTARSRIWANSGLSWSAGDTVAVKLTEPAMNNPATGSPRITGTAQVGQPLYASLGSVADADGPLIIIASYQWIRVDGATETDITGATITPYTPVADDVGKQLKVRLSFTDDLGNPESRTSAATATVLAAPTVPGAPVLTATANGQTQIDLSWTVPDTGGRALDKYSIDVSADGGTTWGPQADVGSAITTYSHTGIR